MSERTWPSVLGSAMSGAEPEDVAWAVDRILEDQATPAQVAAFITALRVRGETPAQVGALVESLMKHGVLVDRAARPPVVVDVVGTGGDGSNSVNISTMAALVVAAAGAPVIKHGNRAASSATGSADALEALGVSIDMDGLEVANCASSIGIAFCFAPLFHPALRFAGPTRRELGVPTVFNIVGPLANPARPEAMLAGCARLESAPVMAQVLLDRGTRALVVRGDDGLDEISICATTRVWDATGSELVEGELDPRRWGIDFVDPQLLEGATPERNVELLTAALTPGNASDVELAKVRAIRDAVVVNAAAALTAFDAAVSQLPGVDVSDRIEANLPRARQALDSGAAWALLEKWIAAST
ncbi:MAG: anthranilate phosphoribosyltransferase [Actinomycetota bacterium]|nr:anthranilate phosphoribosyltransferase [Actinomycetota bacterium]